MLKWMEIGCQKWQSNSCILISFICKKYISPFYLTSQAQSGLSLFMFVNMTDETNKFTTIHWTEDIQILLYCKECVFSISLFNNCEENKLVFTQLLLSPGTVLTESSFIFIFVSTGQNSCFLEYRTQILLNCAIRQVYLVKLRLQVIFVSVIV